MTTETTSPSLHERLAIASSPEPYRDGWGRHTYYCITLETLAAIERDMIAEATAPLRQEIEQLEAENNHLNKRFDEDRVYVAAVQKDRTNAGRRCIALTEENDTLRAENAALRQAGELIPADYTGHPGYGHSQGHDAVSVKMDRNGRCFLTVANGNSGSSIPLDWEHASRIGRIMTAQDYLPDAATTPRAEETPDGCRSMGVRDRDTDRNHPGDVGGEEVAEGSAGVGRDDPAEQRGVGGNAAEPQAVAPSPTDEESNDPEIPDSCPTDAAGDQDPAKQARPDAERIDDLVTRADGASSRLDLHMQRMDELFRRLASLEQRADEDHKVIDTIQVWGVDLQKRIAHLEEGSGMAHRTTMKLASDVGTLQGKVERLEARGPQPVAVTPEITEDMWGEGWAAFENARLDESVTWENTFRAGLMASLAAAAKEAGK